MTALVHGAEATARVEAASQALFGRGELAELDPGTLRDAVAQLPRATRNRGDHPVVDLLVDTGLAASRSAARRTIAEGGAYVNNVKVKREDDLAGVRQLLHGRWLVLRRGRRALAAVELVD